jgi:hypothetical protein
MGSKFYQSVKFLREAEFFSITPVLPPAPRAMREIPFSPIQKAPVPVGHRIAP